MISGGFRVYLGTMNKITFFFTFFHANLTFKVIRMILALMPSMAIETLEALTTCILIHTDRLGSIPLAACFTRILEKLRFASVVLPVVRVYTSLSLMRGVDEWTPYCLVMEVVEVGIKREFANLVDAHLGLVVGKGAVLSVVAESCRREVTLAEFCFIFVRVVKLFYSGVAIDTGFALGALFLFSDKAAKL
jgi:hypothetical protein